MKKVIMLILKFKKTQNLFNLADAYLIIKKHLDKNEFPIEKYSEYINEKK